MIDAGDRVLKFYQSQTKSIAVTWRAYQNKSYLQYKPNGWTNNQNGTFRFCLIDQAHRFNRALIINRSGRARLSSDSDGDGSHEDSEGNVISC